MKKPWLIGLLLLWIPSFLFGQDIDNRLAEVQKALNEERLDSAIFYFDLHTDYYISEQDYLNLSYFIPQAGYIGQMQGDVDKGMERVKYWLDFIQSRSQDPRVLRQAYLESHTYYLYAGKTQMAYDANQTALTYTYQIPDHTPSEWAIIERNLGVIANYLGNPDLARKHTLKALEGFDLDPNTSSESRFNILNDLGVRYWYAAKWDSAEYYWKEGIRYLGELEENPTNQLYRAAMIEGNLAAVYDIKGKLDESVKMIKSSIAKSKAFLEAAPEDPKRNRALLTVFYNSANLGITYKNMGNYHQALQIHDYNLKQKEKHFPPGHPEITDGLVFVGQAHNALMNYAEARKFLQKAIENIEKADGEFNMQLADIYYTLALVAEGENKVEEAKSYYKTAKSYFEKANRDAMDFVYLGFLGHAATFFALNGEGQYALKLSQEGYDYIQNIEGINSLSGYQQTINRGKVFYHLEDFGMASDFAGKSMGILELLLADAKNSGDSVRIEYEKPMAILLKRKAAYRQLEEPGISFLEETVNDLQTAMALLEKRKAMLSDAEDLGILLSQNQELVDFLKTIELELHEKSGQDKYLEDLLATHESSVYAKIRTQLNQQRQINFFGVPQEVIEEEARLRNELENILIDGQEMESFIGLTDQWNSFLDMLKSDYPNYYRTRYGDIRSKDLNLPILSQVVRFVFVEDELKAIVLKDGKKQLFHLDFNPHLVKKLPDIWHDQKALGKVTHQLYQQIWAPFAHLLVEERVIIIPDGLLFNLSFDLLTDREIGSYKEFVEYSLLARHDISYRFSLWQLLEQSNRTTSGNYVAFAPGFLDEMKENYLGKLKDSLNLDQAYLSLLPQPFTVNLAQKAAGILGGRSFTYENSTPEAFYNHSGKNKIIHIATHAESNNLSPAFSRLIFAKSDNAEEDNSVYAYQIYGTNLQANLTVLTACETGRPIHQPGEGMISLAHAFQYAGSESLLTSLWKLDEKASMEITEYFLELIAKGEAKDRALRMAKLAYLSGAKGRTLSPEYWAGIVLIGDPESINDLKKTSTLWYWAIAMVFLFALIFYFFKRRPGF